VIPGLVLAGGLSFIVCFALVPLVRKLCLHFTVLDQPGPLKIHARPIPRLGGIAVTLAIAGGLLISTRQGMRAMAFFLLALAIVWLVGLADDLRSVSPRLRLAAQITSGVVLWLGGWRFASAAGPLGSGPTSLLLVCAVVPVFANSWNLLDGSDGIAAGNAAIVAASFLVIWRGGAEPVTCSIAVCLAASCAGFLPYNWPRASIYLGDGGSTVLGFCVAVFTLSPRPSNHPSALFHFAPLIVAGLPLVDTALAVVRRVRRRQSILDGDRRHLYDEMIALVWSARRVALATYGITLGLALIAWLGVQYSFRGFFLAWGLSLAGLLLIAIRLGCLKSEPPAIPAHSRITVAVRPPAGRPF
jgi:UDP-GlcNAc:undecaprenyl-phosphate GlcNAc-1-phosphate transferase